MIFQDTLDSIKNKVTGGGVKQDPAGLFDYSAGQAGAVPGTGQVAQSYLQGKQLYGNALIKFNQERTNTAQGFGYQGDIDPNTGVMSNLRVDQTNPYGAYQMNRRSHADQWDSLRQQNASRRIGGKGLGAQGQSDARFAWGGEDAGQAQDFIGRLAGIDQGQQQAYQGWQDTYWTALAEQTRQSIEDARYNSATSNASTEDYEEAGIDTTPDGTPETAVISKDGKVIGGPSKKAAAIALKSRNATTAARVKAAQKKPAPAKLPPGQARMKAAQAALAAKKKKK